MIDERKARRARRGERKKEERKNKPTRGGVKKNTHTLSPLHARAACTDTHNSLSFFAMHNLSFFVCFLVYIHKSLFVSKKRSRTKQRVLVHLFFSHPTPFAFGSAQGRHGGPPPSPARHQSLKNRSPIHPPSLSHSPLPCKQTASGRPPAPGALSARFLRPVPPGGACRLFRLFTSPPPSPKPPLPAALYLPHLSALALSEFARGSASFELVRVGIF